MTSTRIEINDKIYTVRVVESEEEAEQGLMGVEELSEDEGMLFPYDEEDEVAFWMKNTKIPLKIIFIDEDGNVNMIAKGEPESTEYITGVAKDVLELNIDADVDVGDQIFFIDLEDDDEQEIEVKSMYVLGSDGKPQAIIEGGERIFSRKNTVTLIKMAKRAFKYKNDSNFKALGKKVFKYLDIQESNEPEYVQLPE